MHDRDDRHSSSLVHIEIDLRVLRVYGVETKFADLP